MINTCNQIYAMLYKVPYVYFLPAAVALYTNPNELGGTFFFPSEFVITSYSIHYTKLYEKKILWSVDNRQVSLEAASL